MEALKSLRSSAFLGRAARVATLVTDLVPLTWLGLLTIVTATAAIKLIANPQMDLVLLVVGYAMIGLPLLCALFVWISMVPVARGLKRMAPPLSRSTDTGRDVVSGFVLPSLRFVPFVTVRWEVTEPTALRASFDTKGGLIEEKLSFDERGDVNLIRRAVSVADVFGLARMTLRILQKTSFEVQPNTGAFRELFALSSFAGGDESPHPMGLVQGDRTELRRYAAGDPARFIHWKAFARTRRLLVRQPERALTRAIRTIAYLVAGPDDDATAGVARAALQSRAFGDEWVFGADGASADTSEVAQAKRLIVESGAAKSEGGRGLAAFFARAERSGPASAVLFVPPRTGPWMQLVLAALRTRQPMRIVIGVDSLTEARERPRWFRFFVRSQERDAPTMRELEEVIRAFKKARCEVLVLDRTSGRVWSDAHRKGATQKSASEREAA